MKNIALIGACALALAACTPSQQSATLNSPVPAYATTAALTVQKGLSYYQTGLGLAQVAEITQPGIKPYVDAVAVKAAPFVSAAKAGAQDVATATTLRDLASELIGAAAMYIRAIPAN